MTSLCITRVADDMCEVVDGDGHLLGTFDNSGGDGGDAGYSYTLACVDGEESFCYADTAAEMLLHMAFAAGLVAVKADDEMIEQMNMKRWR